MNAYVLQPRARLHVGQWSEWYRKARAFCQIAFHGTLRNVQGDCDFIQFEPGKKPHFHNARLPSVERFELRQCLVNRERIDGSDAGSVQSIVNPGIERQQLSRVALTGSTASDMVDDHVTHSARSEREKMMTIQHVLRRALSKPCINFVYHHGWCERLPRTEPIELTPR